RANLGRNLTIFPCMFGTTTTHPLISRERHLQSSEHHGVTVRGGECPRAGVMQRFERVVALPDLKKVFFPHRINSLPCVRAPRPAGKGPLLGMVRLDSVRELKIRTSSQADKPTKEEARLKSACDSGERSLLEEESGYMCRQTLPFLSMSLQSCL